MSSVPVTSGRQRPSRRPILAGNWKMNLVAAEAVAFCRALPPGLGQSPGPEVVLFPSFPLLAAVAAALAGTAVGLGGQDLHPEARGAYTGDVSAAQLLDAGCGWVLAGHSERRQGHGEGAELVGRKVAAALDAGLVPVACIGETAAERQAGQTFEVLARQLAPLPWREPLVIAYEPVWAIGTGLTATPDTAAEAHAFVRRRVAELAGAPFASALRILYGGSVTPDSAAELAAAGDVDGFLVGGASLDPARFYAILTALAA
jgi:triosephosphate isomerase